MRRDDFRLEVSNVAWLEADETPRQPLLVVRANVDAEVLRDRLGNGPLTPGEVDITFRFLDDATDDAGNGVLAFANRVTGEFLLEVNAPGSDVVAFVGAARRYAERTDSTVHYRASVRAREETIAAFEKRTLLVYSSDGELLRQQSLIPSGVEI